MRCIPVVSPEVMCFVLGTDSLESHTHESKAAVFNVMISSSIKTEERVSPV